MILRNIGSCASQPSLTTLKARIISSTAVTISNLAVFHLINVCVAGECSKSCSVVQKQYKCIRKANESWKLN